MPEPAVVYHNIMLTINETYCQAIFDTFKTISRTLSGKIQDVLSLLRRNLSAHNLAWWNNAKFKGDKSSRTNLTHGQSTQPSTKKEPTSTQPISGNCKGRLHVLWK